MSQLSNFLVGPTIAALLILYLPSELNWKKIQGWIYAWQLLPFSISAAVPIAMMWKRGEWMTAADDLVHFDAVIKNQSYGLDLLLSYAAMEFSPPWSDKESHG